MSLLFPLRGLVALRRMLGSRALNATDEWSVDSEWLRFVIVGNDVSSLLTTRILSSVGARRDRLHVGFTDLCDCRYAIFTGRFLLSG